jgi:hypothetical protein
MATEKSMKIFAIGTTALLMMGGAGNAYAQCAAAPLNQQAIRTLVGDNTVCGKPGPNYPGGASSSDRWQEEHFGSNNGALWDYKLGTSHPVDPRKQVGTWDAIGGSPQRIQHAYTGGPTFLWTVHDNGTHISFCTAQNGAEHVRAKVKTGTNVGCAAGDYP